MTEQFFERPILNSPYAYPARHWELDTDGQPTNRITETRRRSDLITPVPKPKKRRQGRGQTHMVLDGGEGLSSEEQEYNPTPIINEVRTYVEAWRALPNPDQWLVTPETARLLKHWRSHKFEGIKPFFCQIEAVETAIWLTEVAPKVARAAKFWAHLKGANEQANPELIRLALKLATGAGKTTVMAMLIAWHAVNAARHPSSKTFSRGFLIVAPGITIRDRLRVLYPNDLESYYRHREIAPPDMLADINHAKIVLTNYHAFKLRERMDVAKGTRSAIEGWRGEKLQTLETEGQMLQRVMPELMGMKNIVVLNDEAHHCYRERVKDAVGDTEVDLKGEEKDEAKENNEAARMWISGLEAVKRKLGISLVYDLSATPFFLRGSGYIEGTLFPWTMSDFSLMDAIECGIVKLPRVPVADNVPGGDTPKFRNLWDEIKKSPRGLPKKGRSSAGILFHLTRHLLYNKYRDPGEEPKLHLFGQLKRLTRQWLEGGYLRCTGGTYPAQVIYQEIADLAANRIKDAITLSLVGENPVKAILDAYNPTGSTAYVNFTTSKETRWQTDPRRCHINWVVCDKDWEAEFCRVAEKHPRVRAYVKNQNLGLEVPYLTGAIAHRYLPDFIVQLDDGQATPLNLIVEIKGFRGENAKKKANTMRAYWVPGVNNLGKFGRWAFAEFTSLFEIESDFDKLVAKFCTLEAV